ncbi:iron-containing alcohol dehydrogenase family protein [Ruminiclostridium papyrosolvens]|uniref:Alcohol dehydrogenase n=1 Tax=Ruminiclostridium papyrosolvens C7 TaxID=1330534 RepID=U4R3L8_9FIRM|nr:iron-containing alcohol dehydrogenase family protein [Ruminiclostridium papyrosolvens]EPR12988.1 alcohol dehydrogenase [Ruminiclostridium papyrosolvens C7]
MDNQFEFFMPTKICFEAGISKKVDKYISGKNVLIISDPFLYQSGVAKQIGDSMSGKNVAYFSDVEPNPSCESVDKAAEVARAINADCVIGLGGGSALDISKIVSCLVTNEGSIYDYYSGGSRTLSKRQATLVCIPTTAGTGSEVTNVGVYTNKKAGIKMPMVNNEFWPDYSIIDCELTYTLPAPVTASTGMDAFCHAIEAYWNKASQPICDMLAIGAMKLILDNIKTAYSEPTNKEARAAMIKASLIAGIAFSQTRTTGIHALSFPLTTEFGANHGTACSITLPAFIKISGQQAETKMKALTDYLGFESLEKFSEEIEELMKSMNMPVRLHQIGVKETDLEHITEIGLGAAIIQLTPAVMNNETVYQLLKSIL